MTKNCPRLLTEETEKQLFAESLLPCFLRGESVTAIWVRHAGRKRTGQFLAENSHHFGFGSLGKYRLINVPHGELVEESPQGFFQLMLSCLNPQIENRDSEKTFPLLKKEIKNLTQEGAHLIFILERFDELNNDNNFPSAFYNNLHRLWEIEKTKVHFLFAVATNIFKSKNFPKYSHFKEVISQNLVYFPLLEKKDNEICLQTLQKKYGFKVSPKLLAQIKAIAGGHASLNRACLRALQNFYSTNRQKIVDFLSSQYEVKIILEDIWNSFDDEEKRVLQQIAQGQTFKKTQIPERLLKLGLVKTEKKCTFLFSPLFDNFLLSLSGEAPNISLDAKTGEVLINGLPAKERITLQEYHLLSTFIKKKNSLLSRDQIAQALWGKDFEEKYSDWAIDQVISQLRNKLEKLGIPATRLQTIRNRGYRWLE